MPCIFSREQKHSVWTMWTVLNMNREQMAKTLQTDVTTIDAIMFANAKNAEPKLIYKKTKHPTMLRTKEPETPAPEQKPKPFVRAKGEYSNTNYQNLYLD